MRLILITAISSVSLLLCACSGTGGAESSEVAVLGQRDAALNKAVAARDAIGALREQHEIQSESELVEPSNHLAADTVESSEAERKKTASAVFCDGCRSASQHRRFAGMD